MSAQVLLGRQCCLPAPQGRLQTPAAAARRPAGRRRACAVRAGSDFAQLRSAAADAVAAAQSKLPALEQAARTAARAREPAAEAERHWQELHSKLTTLQRDAAEATKRLRADVAAAAGGEAQATHALLQVHVKDRLDAFRASHGLAAATEWKEFPLQDLPLHSIPGGRMLYQVAGAEMDGQQYAVVALGIANPFLFDNLRSLLLHWGVSEGLHSQWAPPPRGWHTSPGVCTPAGDRAWETQFGAFAPVLGGELVPDATVYSVVLQIPLEGVLELRGGVKCVLRRTDHGQPEWIKGGHHNNADFWLDFQPAIAYFDRKRKAAQAAAIAKARTPAGGRRSPSPPARGRGDAGRRRGREQNRRNWATLMSWDESDSASDSEWEGGPAEAAPEALQASGSAAAAVVEEEEPPVALRSAEVEDLPRWVAHVQQFVQLSDLPQESSQTAHLKCLRRVAAAVGDAGDRSAGSLLQRCGEVESMLQQVDLLDLSSRAAQQEKEQLQAMLKGAMDEQSHLMHELSQAADAARRTAVRLRGRETEITQRDLEAVAQQAADELLKRHSGGAGFWPFSGKDEERQLVFVEQKVMDVAGADATLVVQVFVEGSRAAVEAAKAPPTHSANGNGNGAAPAAEEAAPAVKRGRGRPPKKALEAAAAAAKEAAAAREEPKPKPTFDHVVLGVAVGEKFPDGLLKSPLIMHAGCVAHQGAKWQVPPEQWSCTPDAVTATGTTRSSTQVPFQRYSVAAEDGSPVLVDAYLFALALRMPLKDCLDKGIRGLEFVLKTPEGQWLSWQQGNSNFYAQLPGPK